MNIYDVMLKLRIYFEKNTYVGYNLVQAPTNYFELTLDERKNFLMAPSVDYLCKTIIMENSAYDASFAHPIFYPQYICIIVQFISKLHQEKIIKYCKDLQNSNSVVKAGRSKFHFRLVRDDTAFKLSGYEFNAITPFCMTHEMPLLISKQIKDLKFFWLGGGHPDLKLRIKVDEMVAKLGDKVSFSEIIYTS